MAKADHNKDALKISEMISRIVRRTAELERENNTLRGRVAELVIQKDTLSGRVADLEDQKDTLSGRLRVFISEATKIISDPAAKVTPNRKRKSLLQPKIAVEVTPGTTIVSNRKVGAVIAKRKGTSSQYYGVGRIRSSGKWHARIVRKGARKVFGNFAIEEEAALAVQEFLGNAAECTRIRAIIAEKYPAKKSKDDVRHEKAAADGLAAIGGAFTWKWECKGCGATFDQYPVAGCPKCSGHSSEKIKVLDDPIGEIERAVGRHSEKGKD